MFFVYEVLIDACQVHLLHREVFHSQSCLFFFYIKMTQLKSFLTFFFPTPDTLFYFRPDLTSLPSRFLLFQVTVPASMEDIVALHEPLEEEVRHQLRQEARGRSGRWVHNLFLATSTCLTPQVWLLLQVIVAGKILSLLSLGFSIFSAKIQYLVKEKLFLSIC